MWIKTNYIKTSLKYSYNIGYSFIKYMYLNKNYYNDEFNNCYFVINDDCDNRSEYILSFCYMSEK